MKLALTHKLFLIPLTVAALTVSSCRVTEPTQASVASESTVVEPEHISAENLCVTDTEGFGPGDIALTALECKTNEEITFWLQGVSISMATVAAVCGVVPEPFVTKGTAALVALGSAVTGTASFVIQNLPCDGPVELSEGTEKAIVKVFCEKSGKTYKEDGPDGKPVCLDE